MSLINDMLKNLETRKAPAHEKPYVPLVTTEKTTTILSHKKIMLPSLLALMLTSILVMTVSNHKEKTVVPNLSNIVQSPKLSETPTAQVDDSWTKPVSITGITLQLKDNITEVSFLLNHVALYRLTSDSFRNQISIIIDHAELQSELPNLNFLTTAIQRINTEQIKGDTKFTFTLYPESIIKYVNISSDSKNPELVIAIENRSKPIPAQTAQANKIVKTPAIQTLLAERYQSALSLAETGDYRTAIKNLSSLVKVDPEYSDARVSLAALLLDQGNRVKAASIVNDGLNISPSYPPLIELKARLLSMDGKVKQAINLLQSTLPPMDENPEYHALIAALYARNNNDRLAVKIYQELLATNAHNGNWWFGLGVSLDRLGRAPEALNAFSKAAAEGHLNTESVAYLHQRLESLQESVNEKS